MLSDQQTKKKNMSPVFSCVCVEVFSVCSFILHIFVLLVLRTESNEETTVNGEVFIFIFFVFPRTHRMEIKHLFAAVIGRME